MENKTARKNRAERLKRLSAQGMSLEELIRCVMSADPKPLWEQEKEERKAKKEKKAKKKMRKTTT
jgi:hypothetical protein